AGGGEQGGVGPHLQGRHRARVASDVGSQGDGGILLPLCGYLETILRDGAPAVGSVVPLLDEIAPALVGRGISYPLDRLDVGVGELGFVSRVEGKGLGILCRLRKNLRLRRDVIYQLLIFPYPQQPLDAVTMSGTIEKGPADQDRKGQVDALALDNGTALALPLLDRDDVRGRAVDQRPGPAGRPGELGDGLPLALTLYLDVAHRRELDALGVHCPADKPTDGRADLSALRAAKDAAHDSTDQR